MKNFQNKKHLQIVLVVLIAVITLGIGYASISAINLIINGNATASVNQNNFDVHFVSTGDTPSLTGNVTPTGSASISQQDNKVALFDVGGMTKVGDYAAAVYTVRNDSNGIGAEITLNLTSSNTEYFKVTETILDDKLQAGEETTAKVKVEMIKTPITDSVSTSIKATLTASPLENDASMGGSASSKASDDPVSFLTDSWATIQKAVQNNNTSAYNVGDTKEVTINGTNYTVRIANKTIGEHCGDNDTAYSQTACGFVVEFAEVVEKRTINSTATNVGGWPATKMRTYLNGTFYNSLPSDLQAAIKPTRVISGHGKNDSTNFTTTDKLYLLSSEEVYGDDGQYHFYDTAYGTSHQLEYYSNNGVTYSTSSINGTNLDKAIKQYNSSNTWWWLRPAHSNGSSSFAVVNTNGNWNLNLATNTYGVAPAFRIG